MSVLKRLAKYLSVLRWINPFYSIRRAAFALANWRRKRFKKLDYILLTLSGDIAALPEERPWWQRRLQGDPPMSLYELDAFFKRIAQDLRPKGLILNLRNLEMSLAHAETFRNSLLHLREAGKQVIVLAQKYDLPDYFIASVADQILLKPGGEVSTLGVRLEAAFLKDALQTVGIEIESTPISPYKTALDQFTHTAPSPEFQAQYDWLLDARYDLMVSSIAAGRGISQAEVEQMIDTAPHLDDEALAKGYVHGIVHEEDLAEYLNVEHIITDEKAERVLLNPWKKSQSRYVALLPISGVIIDGKSGAPPIELPIPIVGGDRAGDMTVIQQVRQLLEDEAAAAVIVYIDSPGGSAAASEAMASALDELAKSRPLVAFMSSTAASGGYYVATPAQWIIAQPGTITGSIGVISGRPSTKGLYEKLNIHRFQMGRGANFDFQSDFAPLNEHQREQMRRSVQRLYQLFIGRVSKSRNMSLEAVDAVAAGRVWTGTQAFSHGLVDELGDLQTALKKARELADLPQEAPLVFMDFEDKTMPPMVAENPAAALKYVLDGFKLIYNHHSQYLMPFTLD